jgi:hypothetical protein
MAKSADAADLKSAGRKAVGVQVPLRAPIQSTTYKGNFNSAKCSRYAFVPLRSDFARIASRNLRQMRALYRAWPEPLILQTTSGELA